MIMVDTVRKLLDLYDRSKPVAKAIVAFLGSLAAALAWAIEDGDLTLWELLMVIATTLGVSGSVYLVPNKASKKASKPTE